jgi:hypothetical protein
LFVGEGAWGRIEASAIAVCKARSSGSCRAGGRTLEAERFRVTLGWSWVCRPVVSRFCLIYFLF